MAITTSRVTVGTSATKVAENTVVSSVATDDYSILSFAIEPEADPEPTLYWGPAGVTTATGCIIKPKRWPFCFDLEPGESLYMIAAAGSHVVHVGRGGR